MRQDSYGVPNEHENRIGVVLTSTAVVAYSILSKGSEEGNAPYPTTTLFLYAVQLEEGIIVRDVEEHLLEDPSGT